MNLIKLIKEPINILYSNLMEWDEPRRLRKIYCNFLQPNDLVFDIGANIGNFVHTFLRFKTKVIAVEPNPQLIPGLKQRFNGKNVVIVNKGIASKNGYLSFNVFKETGHCTFYENSPKVKEQKYVKSIKVETTTLNDLIKVYGKPKFIKIDVEGFEFEVLKTLKSPVPYIAFEFTNSIFEVAQKCLDHLTSLGNPKFNYSLAVNHKFEIDHWVSKDELLKSMKNIPKNHLFGDIYVKFN